MAPSSEPAGRQLGLLWAGVVVVLIASSPVVSPLVARGAPACPMKRLTGLPCPGCGTTRAALALADLDPIGAVRRYPLPALAWIAFLTSGLIAGGLALAGRSLPRLPSRLPVWAQVAIVLAVLGNWAWSIATGV